MKKVFKYTDKSVEPILLYKRRDFNWIDYRTIESIENFKQLLFDIDKNIKLKY